MTTRSTKPVARLDASLLLARKGEAQPAIAATQHNNPGLAWGAPLHPQDFQNHAEPAPHHTAAAPSPAAQGSQQPPSTAQVHPHPRATPVVKARLRPDSFASRSAKTGPRMADRDPVALTLRVEDGTYLRLKYLAQSTGRSTQQVLSQALEQHLDHRGVPATRKLVVKPE